MNIALWLLAGGLVGIAAFVALNLNLRRGLISSVAIGIAGGFFGGYLLAPLLGAAAAETGGFSPFALVVAGASALALLSISDMAAKRFGL
jgi:uncharacterized membrane protein YeaQ/YmgE (transglycosylase-associated protein family)